MAGGFLGVVRQAGQAGLVLDMQRVGVGGIQHVVGEGLGQLGLLLLDLSEARLLVLRQLGTAQAEAAQFVFDQLVARRAHAGELRAGGQRLYLSYKARLWPSEDQNSVMRGRFSA